MRWICALAFLTLAACTQQGTAIRIDERTFHITGPGMPGGSDAPNRRIAERLCPKGYRVLDSIERKNSPDGLQDQIGRTFTDWTVRCL
jgi:hypothetical protein